MARSKKRRVRKSKETCPSQSIRAKSTRAARRLEKRIADKAIKKELIPSLNKTLRSGAGLPVDKQLREFFKEYNTRLLRLGPESLPSSYAVTQDFFVQETRPFLVLRLRNEKDHVFAFSDFIDFATSEDAPGDPYASARTLPEGVIHSYNCCDDPHDLLFSTGDGRQWGVGGVALMRHNEIVTVMLIAGRNYDEDESPIPAPDWSGTRREWLRPHPSRHVERVPLADDASDLWRTIVFVRLNIAEHSVVRRFVYTDIGTAYLCLMDDLSQFRDSLTDLSEEALNRMYEKLAEHDTLFEICKTCILLPDYFAFKITLVRDEDPPARLAPRPASKRLTDLQSGDEQPATADTADTEAVQYRRVSALRIISTTSERVARRYTPPAFQIEVRGFWRELKPGVMGKDQAGEPVEGRTWIHPHSRWTDLPKAPKVVLVKSRVALARSIAESERLAKQVGRTSTPVPVATEVSRDEDRPESQRVSKEEAYRQRQLLTPKLRWKIIDRDNFRCTVCGADAAADSSVRLEVDHITPVTYGGKTEISNLRTLCAKCNKGKSDTHP